ncbi:MAG TPA: glutathione S-transferase family protein [Caulobacteraceae bacterium]|jgi:glutathione S-transferase|nr:glutathione S-transferase family protein [Caulobacteraceae bacterium]
MALTLYSHPFSSYCQKVLIALYENDTPFTPVLLEGPEAMAELEALWSLKRFPVLVDHGKTVIETSVIIEHLGVFHPGPMRLIPDDPAEALEVRWMDRFFDNYVGTPQGRVVFNAIRPEGHRDPYGVTEAKAMLDKAYAWLDGVMADREWAAGSAFSLADCAAAPHLFYADWTHPIPAECANVHAYRRRLLARPSFARAVDEARPFRHYFPLGAPDRD